MPIFAPTYENAPIRVWHVSATEWQRIVYPCVWGFASAIVGTNP